MRSKFLGYTMLGAFAVSAGLSLDARAQQPAQPNSVPPAGVSSPSAVTTPPAASVPMARPDESRSADRRGNVVDASTLEFGANSFTEGQARARFEDAGITAIEGLRKDDNGIWRGRGTHAGAAGDVAMDFRGRIAFGPGVATMRGTGNAASAPASTGSAVGSARPDGTPGNPPGTAAGRALDRATGNAATAPASTGSTVGNARPDGTPGNPPGTAAGRALDRATGSNTTGTNPPAAAGGGTTPVR